MSLAWLKANVVLGSIGKLAAASLLFATLGLSGCGTDPVKKGVAKGCTLNSDCNGGLVCSFGLCHQECEVTPDCPAGQRCVQSDKSNVCQLTDEAECHFNTDCAAPLVCAIDRQCRNQCQGDADCLSGQQCADGVCAEPTEVNKDGGLKGAVTGAGGEGGGGNESTPTAGSGGTGGSSVGAGGEAGEMGQAGMPAVNTCVPGGDCVPTDKPCSLGTITCDGNTEVCMAGADADDGTDCGTNKVCSTGSCVDCKAGDTCQPDANNTCLAGTLSCANGPSCDAAGNVTAGTSCGTDKVCSGSACVDCKVGDDCIPTNTCKNGTMACAAGPVCNPTTSKTAGTTCDTGKVCDSAASCVACVQDGSCSVSGQECHQGKQDCTTGPNCVDTQLPVSDGVSCTGPAAYNFCTAGVCAGCQTNTACTPTNPCHKGLWNCATTPPTCTDQNSNATDGIVCDVNKSCISGACLTNDRVLKVTSGAVADTAIDNSFTSVTVHLVDGNNANVAGAAVTVVPSAGAYAVASAGTNAQGNAQISGRVGRAIGTYKFTVSAPGASSIEFDVNAIAANAGDILTLVNVNHLSGVSTVPGAGTISKLSSEARAVVAATDGTLYLASYCAVFQLTPSGVLTRIAGTANEGCGTSGTSGDPTTVQMYYVVSLALDEANNYLYIADSDYRIFQVDLVAKSLLVYAGSPTATNSAPYGDGGPSDSAYMSPSNIAVAPNGDLYISDSNSSRIRKVDYNTGVINSVFTSGACSANTPVTFNGCYAYGDACSFAWDKSGTLFISGEICGGGASGGYRGVARVDAGNTLVAVAGTTGAANAAEGGTATSAAFTYTPYIAFDKAGNLYLATRYDQRVRRIDALTTKITTVAGTGTSGFSGDYAAGNAATIDNPTMISFDGAGNLYFADAGNVAIRSVYGVGSTVVPTGTLATTAGTGQTVKRDAAFAALTVKLSDSKPAGVATVNIQWKRLQTGSGLGATGAIATTTKTSGAGSASMTGRVGLASGDYKFEASYTDIHGTAVTGSPQTFTVTAADPNAGDIFAVTNYVHTSGLGGYPGPATFGKLQQYAMGIAAASDGTMYVADQCAVYQVTARGEFSVFAGTPGGCGFSGDSGPANGAKLYYPEGLALDETNGVLYIADYENARVRAVDMASGTIDTFAGGGAVSVAPFGDGGPATDANIYYPYSVSVDANGLVYIPDNGHNKIRVVDPATGIITTWLAGNTTCVNGTVQLYSVSQYSPPVRFLANGDAYVSANICPGTTTTYALGIALRAKSNGAMTRIAGLSGGITTENADATASSIPDLADVIIDGSGNLVLSMYSAQHLRRIDMTTGKISTIAGDAPTPPTAPLYGYAKASDMTAEPGAYVAASGVLLYNPWKLALWPGGHVLVSDAYNYAVRMIW